MMYIECIYRIPLSFSIFLIFWYIFSKSNIRDEVNLNSPPQCSKFWSALHMVTWFFHTRLYNLIFELQLLTQFLIDYLKIQTTSFFTHTLNVWYILKSNLVLFQIQFFWILGWVSWIKHLWQVQNLLHSYYILLLI